MSINAVRDRAETALEVAKKKAKDLETELKQVKEESAKALEEEKGSKETAVKAVVEAKRVLLQFEKNCADHYQTRFYKGFHPGRRYSCSRTELLFLL